jgi:two-component sensor histidine kinase
MDKPQAKPMEEVANSLALALITSSMAPVVLLDGNLALIAASESFCQAFTIDAASLPGKPLAELGHGEWNIPQLASLLNATASGHADIDAYEMDLRQDGKDSRRLVVNAIRLRYGASGATRLLLTVSDVTEARIAEKLKDDLLREKAMLLQELQHRVANSLQIIASVLLQSARRVQSDETRSHLQAAHQRVMSVASLQKQLSAASADDVALRAYFTDLCQSLGASMIRDHNKLSIEVSADDSVTSADISVSLGLIVTELVINALKHAFPDDRGGKITVGYASAGSSGWTLSVGDNGVGIPKQPENAKSGLGTSIVRALARQLNATVSVVDDHPGTLISINRAPDGRVGGGVIAPVAEAAL